LPNHKSWPFAVNITLSKSNGLDKEGYVNLKQLRIVDESRIENKQGRLERYYFPKIKEALKIILDIGA
jgi:mRNA interferase MazF